MSVPGLSCLVAYQLFILSAFLGFLILYTQRLNEDFMCFTFSVLFCLHFVLTLNEYDRSLARSAYVYAYIVSSILDEQQSLRL